MKISSLFYDYLSRKIIHNIVFTFLLIYFAYHSIWGDRGINSYFKLHHNLGLAYEKLSILRSDRLEIENITNLIKTGDRDILEEYAKNILGVAYSEEKVFNVKEK